MFGLGESYHVCHCVSLSHQEVAKETPQPRSEEATGQGCLLWIWSHLV